MANAIKISNTLIITINGKTYSNSNLSETDQELVLNKVSTLDETNLNEIDFILNMIKQPDIIDDEETVVKKEIKTWIDNLDTDLFYKSDEQIYMNGIALSMPMALVKRIMESKDDERDGLINFWKLCALNENSQSRQEAFLFLETYKFPITKNGYFVGYRHVLKVDNKFEKAVKKHIKQVKEWKRSLKYYTLLELKLNTGSKYVIHEKRSNLKNKINKLGKEYNCSIKVHDTLFNLKESSSQVTYTDNHTKTFEIKLGEIVEMKRTDCDANPKRDCSYGLHIGNPDFVSNGGFGNVPIAVLVNPKDIIAVPEYSVKKMRVCKYLPYSLVEFDKNGKIIELNQKEVYEEKFSEITQQEIEDILNNTTLNDLYENKVIPNTVDIETLQYLKTEYSKMNTVIKKRKIKL